ncbi:hypothetical protein CGERO_05705 [Corynebacterium gerontici]|uniref:Uncharacterized protein n=1 Tax=Corynebacterium gerontici TaxID=2079234 RepID=A0A3G6J3A2_9CORY|nr:hypothetical protein CGERO_05705 [Corynebacterium gerontici]
MWCELKPVVLPKRSTIDESVWHQDICFTVRRCPQHHRLVSWNIGSQRLSRSGKQHSAPWKCGGRLREISKKSCHEHTFEPLSMRRAQYMGSAECIQGLLESIVAFTTAHPGLEPKGDILYR